MNVNLISGYLRDVTGSYYLSFNYIGLMCIIGAVMIYFLPNFQIWNERRTENVKRKLGSLG